MACAARCKLLLLLLLLQTATTMNARCLAFWLKVLSDAESAE